jgi:hypothetical protein
MPIPATTSTDVLLRTLLIKQVALGYEGWIDLADALKCSPNPEADRAGPGAFLPAAVREDVLFLENHSLIEFRPDNPHVRLTPMGVYFGLLFDIV